MISKDSLLVFFRAIALGRTPMATFLDGKKDWKWKVDNLNLN